MNPGEKQNPRSAEYAEMQRQRILDAAEQAFIERGFHAASMADIAERADISQGLAYRYFASKQAIILAIIERQLEERRENIRSLHSKTHLVDRVVELFKGWATGDRSLMNPTLFTEMSAEASRNQEIQGAVSQADSVNRQEFTHWLKRRAKAAGRDIGEREIEMRAFALQAFVEGLALRALREPAYDPTLVEESIRLVVPRILEFLEDCRG